MILSQIENVQPEQKLSSEQKTSIVPSPPAIGNTNVMRFVAGILSWFLHNANREGKNVYFYKIKNRILSKYGTHICYDVQFIEGKKCHSCGGTGIHISYSWYSNEKRYDGCYRCYGGWYKRPVWNILQRVQFGKYIFHQPYERVYKKPEIEATIIEGYIDHERSRYGKFCLHILFLIYEKGYLKRYYNQTGIGWYIQWWRPKNWIPNIIHLIKKREKSIPATNLKNKSKELFKRKKPLEKQVYEFTGDDLPF